MAVQFFFKTRQTDDARWRVACADACSIPGVKSKVSAKAGLFLIVPLNALTLISSVLKDIPFRTWAPPDDGPTLQFWPSLGHIPEVRWAEPGEVIAAQFGILFDNRHSITLMPWQKSEPIKFKKQSFLAHHPPGSGKSATALLWALLETGSSILIVTTAKARLNWAREVKRYTKVEPELILGETPTKLSKLPRISITAFETLSAQIEALQELKPITLIVDESHRAANRKRARMVPAEVEQIGRNLPKDLKELKGKKPVLDSVSCLWIIPPDGAKQLDDGRWVKFEDRENLASSMAKLARTARRRCLTTATPIKNRRVDLWAQLDYLDPWGFGTSSNWRRRYCGAAEIGYNSSLIDTGRTHTKELIGRLNTLRSFVPVSITHKHLPRLRRDTFYVPIEAQNKSDFARTELKTAHAKGHAAGLEADLLDACSRKRRPVAAAIVEALGGSPPPDTKIVVFTGRRSDVGKLKDEIARSLLRFRLTINAFGEVENRVPEIKAGEAAPPEIKLWASHGDDSAAVRHRYVEEYMVASGPAIFIGTRDAFGECVPPDTLLLGDKNQTIDAHEKNDVTYGATGRVKISKTWERHFKGDLITIKAMGMLPFSTTPGHPILTFRGQYVYWRDEKRKGYRVEVDPQIIWRPADEVIPQSGNWKLNPSQRKPGDYVLIPRLPGTDTTSSFDLDKYTKNANARNGRATRGLPTQLKLDSELAWLIGLFVAEGSTSKEIIKNSGGTTWRAEFSLGAHEPELIEKLRAVLIKRGFKPYTRRVGNGVITTVKSTPFALLMRELCGTNCHDKRIPQVLLLHKNSALLEVCVEGYVDGDGHRAKKGRVACGTASRQLALTLQLAQARLGRLACITSSTPKQSFIRGRQVKSGLIYTIGWRELEGGHKKHIVYTDCIATPVQAVTRSKYDGPVHDIETKDHTFLSSNAIIHNSIDLHSTDLVYMMMLPWTNGDILQNEYRFSRLGGTRPCLILYVIAEGTADEYVASIVIDKLPDMIEVGGHQELTGMREVLRGGKSESELRECLAAAILAGLGEVNGAAPSNHDRDVDRDGVVAPAVPQQSEYEELI